ncbi:hypothetical protein [Paracoccus sp. SCSIO 75233]|uniref:hypothetical protein n=1 Tax=Paracoccus sp. SCSIO 75233 TaxID=3017782 RepID=UPI0022EFDD92|nr:hypothetical protein [Paracoccus sp. SCSIO 75233]WBU51910.1 hypothetical protein PAF12_08625 [Paracoccus sp. SCSIO 75233]
MRTRTISPIGVGLILACGAANAQIPDPGFGGGAQVEIMLSDVSGARLERPVAGEPFRILVRLSDPGSGQPVADEHLSGWIRPVEASNDRCRDAARSYFVNQGALPRGSTDLARSLYAVRHDDGNVSIIDWEHSIASANILAMVPVPDLAGPLTALPDDFAFAAPSVRGERVQIDATLGAKAEILPPIAAAGEMLVTSNGWMARGDRLIAPDDGVVKQLPGEVRGIQPAFPDEDYGGYEGVVALLENGAAFIAREGEDMTALVQGPANATSAAHSAEADAVLFVDGGTTFAVSYGGRPATQAQLPAPASRISVSLDGVYALAWSPDSSAVSIIEIATASVIQAVELNRAPLNQPVREVGFAEDAAFLLLERLDFVMVVDLDQVRRGEPAGVRAVRIGPPVEDIPDDAGPFLIETVRGHSSGSVLALHPDLSTAFPVKRDSGGNATAPMNGFRIRGGRPLTVAELSGGLRETEPGDYAAATVLAYGGPYELVVSAGPGRFTACTRFDVQGEYVVGLQLALQAATETQGTDRTALTLSLRDEDGVNQIWPGDMPVVLQSLESGWRDRVVARSVSEGLYRASLGAIPDGLVSIAFDASLPARISINPVIIEVGK